MTALMDLVAGDMRAILLAIAVDDWDALADQTRFTPSCRWAAASTRPGSTCSPRPAGTTGGDDPADFIDARRELDGPGDIGERSIERVDEAGSGRSPGSPTTTSIAVAGRWIDLLDEEFGDLPREDKPWIRQLASDLVGFARSADRSPDVLFAWSL